MFCFVKLNSQLIFTESPFMVYLLKNPITRIVSCLFTFGMSISAFSVSFQSPSDSIAKSKVIYSDRIENKRESIKSVLEGDFNKTAATHVVEKTEKSVSKTTPAKTEKISKNAEVNAAVIKYRRSSLYTLMVTDNSREHATVIQNAFGDWELSEKFNDQNIGPYVLDAERSTKDQQPNITSYLTSNNVAKNLVAKWFKRSPKGGFSMDMIAERGLYNASELDVQQSKMNTRGLAVLSDAGEQLIGNTFVLVNDFKFVSKEDVASAATAGLKLLGSIAAAAGNTDLRDASNVTAAGATIAGKGYVIKTTSYLYKLVWNDSVSAVFYNDYWTEDKNFSQAKKDAFDNSNIFSLKYVGSETAWADLQSSIFTEKSDAELISIATTKATDAGIAKLQRKYEQFRTSTPLLTESPITAQIGLKEGLEAGDKFEVLEQTLDAKGKTGFKKVGVIKVSKSIWDNRYMADQDPKNEGQPKFTTFTKVSGGSFYPGMLIKQK